MLNRGHSQHTHIALPSSMYLVSRRSAIPLKAEKPRGACLKSHRNNIERPIPMFQDMNFSNALSVIIFIVCLLTIDAYSNITVLLNATRLSEVR